MGWSRDGPVLKWDSIEFFTFEFDSLNFMHSHDDEEHWEGSYRKRKKKKTNGIIKKNKNTVNVRQILLIKKEILL
jgi:hypothetical protein